MQKLSTFRLVYLAVALVMMIMFYTMSRVVVHLVGLSTHPQIMQKVMWRTNDSIDCPESCTFDQPWEDCQCRCNADLMEGRTAAEVRYSSAEELRESIVCLGVLRRRFKGGKSGPGVLEPSSMKTYEFRKVVW